MKKLVKCYSDDTEFQKLEQIAEEWGVSMSGAMRRLIREAKISGVGNVYVGPGMPVKREG